MVTGQTSANILANHTGPYPNWQQNNQQEQPQPNQLKQPDQPTQSGQQNRYTYPPENSQQLQDFEQQYNPDSILSYYTEDTALNQLYAQLHVQQPFWFSSKKYLANKQQNQGYGENVYYLYQQALARYNLERLSNQLPPVTPITYNQPIQVYALAVNYNNN